MKVLIVDDNQYNRELIRFILEDFNYLSICAENGLQACEHIEQDKDIDIILMDVNMPVMDGFAATQKIKAMNIERFLPILFVTALDNEDTLSKCLSVGGDDFIPKPVNEKILVAKLKAHHRTITMHQQLLENNESLRYHQQVMERENNIVEHVFQNDMKRMNVSCDNINFHVSPMTTFNGDLILVSRSPSGGVYTLLGDFTGHGLSAAIGSLPVSDIFYTLAEKQASVGEMAREMNLRLLSLLPDNMFFCAAIVELNVGGDRLSIWSGGMNDIILLNAEGTIEKKIESQHMPLGVLEANEFGTELTIVQPSANSHLYLYTDGVTESMNTEGEYFGEEGLEEILCRPVQSGADDKVSHVFTELDKFLQGADQKDDVSLLEIACRPVVYNGEEGASTNVQPEEVSSRNLTFPLCFSAKLMPEALRSGDNVKQLLAILEGVQGFKEHRDTIYTVLAELYSNALEHGLLVLDSSLKESMEGFGEYYEQRQQRLSELSDGEIDIRIMVQPGDQQKGTSADVLTICITDSGPGFNTKQPRKDFDESQAFGRGISIVHSLCDELIYSNNGRTASVTYSLS